MGEAQTTTAPRLAPFVPRNVFLYGSGALVAFFMVRVLGPGWNGHFPAGWPDAIGLPDIQDESYMYVAGKGPLRPSFYFEYRPPAYPLFLWVFGRSAHLIVIGQTVAYCAAVLAMCATAWQVLRSRVIAVMTIALILGVAVQAKYALWNTQVLTESLSITLAFAGVAAWWRLAAAPTVRRAWWAFAWVILGMELRDAEVLPIGVVVVPIALAAALLARGSVDRKVRRTLVLGVLAVGLAAGHAYVAEDVTHRARLSFHHTVGLIVLTNPDISGWFEDRGMPLDDALRSRQGKSGYDDRFWRDESPEFARYRAWVEGSGRRDLVLSMVFLFPEYRDLLYKDLPRILKADLEGYDGGQAYQHLPREMPLQLGGPTTRKSLAVWLVVAATSLAAAAAVATARRRDIRVIVFVVGGIVLALIELYLSWLGDATEVERHSIGALARLAVMLVIAVAISADTIMHGLRPTPTAAVPADDEPDDAPDDPAEAELAHA
ncbi:MAG: hypothetical protein ACT4OX_08835 [Actinomycetota bacterium]